MTGYFPLITLAVLISVYFLDTRIALGIKELLKTGVLLQKEPVDIPDLLSLLVWSGSGLLLGNSFIHRIKGISNEKSRFSLLAGYAILCAFFLKWILKLVFGRTNTRAWLENRASDGFHWFQGGGMYSGFPSGHMAVFTAFFTAIWLVYPRYRSVCSGLTLLLGIALIATGYHFLSDVIAGAYLGVLATGVTRACTKE